MRSLFFIGRHGSTNLNDSNLYRGWSDGPDAQLNKNGLKSAHETAKFLVGLKQPFGRIICSPLGRALKTAAIIAEYFDIENLHVDERLRPLNVGDFAGTKKTENKIEPFLENKNKRFPNGENVNEFEARQHDMATDILKYIEFEKGDEELLVIAHVSNVMYWWNVQTGKNSDEYLGEKSDIISPGGVSVVTEHTTLPLYKPNLEAVGISDKERDAVEGHAA